MPTASGAHIKYAWQHQADAVLNQAAPVQNTWYTVLAATEDVRVVACSIRVETANETLEVEMVIDGVTYIANQLAVAATTYTMGISGNPVSDTLNSSLTAVDIYRAFLIEGQNIRLRIRKTTALGAGNLKCKLVWARLLPT